MGGKITPQAGFLNAIFERFGVVWCTLVTFPKYGWATRKCNQVKSSTIQDFKMAAAKPEIVKFLQNSSFQAM